MDKANNDTSEVKSYFWSSLVNGLSNMATTAGSAIANGAGHVASAVGNIPVVGNVLQGGISSLGNGLGQMVSGNLGGGLSSLYTGADKLLGGMLPGGQAFGAGYLGNMYGAADRALGGYLPNIGGVGATPGMMNGNALAQMQNAGGSFQDPRLLNGKSFDPSSMSPFKGGGVMGNINKMAQTAQTVGGIASLLAGNRGGTGQAMAQYPMVLQAGAGGGRSPLATQQRNDPAMKGGTAVGTSRNADKNKTPGMAQVTAGKGASGAVGELENTQQIIDGLKEQIGMLEQSHMDRAGEHMDPNIPRDAAGNPIMNPLQTAEFRDTNSNGVEDRAEGIYLPRDYANQGISVMN